MMFIFGYKSVVLKRSLNRIETITDYKVSGRPVIEMKLQNKISAV